MCLDMLTRTLRGGLGWQCLHKYTAGAYAQTFFSLQHQSWSRRFGRRRRSRGGWRSIGCLQSVAVPPSLCGLATQRLGFGWKSLFEGSLWGWQGVASIFSTTLGSLAQCSGTSACFWTMSSPISTSCSWIGGPVKAAKVGSGTVSSAAWPSVCSSSGFKSSVFMLHSFSAFSGLQTCRDMSANFTNFKFLAFNTFPGSTLMISKSRGSMAWLFLMAATSLLKHVEVRHCSPSNTATWWDFLWCPLVVVPMYPSWLCQS